MMNKQQILKKIGNIIQELKEQHEYLGNVEELSPLELELFTANADFLIDHIEILKKLSKFNEHKNLALPPAGDQTENVVFENIGLNKLENKEEVYDVEDNEIDDKEVESVENETDKKSFFSFSFDEEPAEMVFDFEKKIAVEDVFDRELTEEEQEFLKAKSTDVALEDDNLSLTDGDLEEEVEEEEEEIGPEPFIVEKKIEENAPTLTEVFEPKKEIVIENNVEEKRLTLNEMLSSKLGNKTDKSGSKTIVDLKVSISLNDKMVFIKELFNGYNLAYSEAIEIINRFESFEAADNFLQKNYAKKNDWDAKTAVVDRLYDYLNRKFLS